MFAQKKRSNLWFSLIALSLVPTNAFAFKTEGRSSAEPQPDAGNPAPVAKAHDLSLAEAKEVLKTSDSEEFRLDLSNGKIQLQAFVYKACTDFFDIVAHNHPGTELEHSEGSYKLRKVNFQVSDRGGGEECVKKESARPGAEIALKSSAAVSVGKDDSLEVGIFSHKPGTFSPKVELIGKRKGAVELALDEEAEEARELLAEIAGRKKQLETCRGSLDELVLAEEAFEMLKEVNALAEDEISRTEKSLRSRRDELKKQALKKELLALLQKAERAPISELELLRIELADFASSNESRENHQAVANIYAVIAKRYVNDKAATPESFELASSTVKEAKDLSQLPDSERAKLGNYERDIAIGRVANLIPQPGVGPMAYTPFYNAYGSLMRGLQSDMYSACYGRNKSMTDCSSATAALQQGQQIMTEFQQREAYFRQQTQQSMMSPMIGAPSSSPLVSGSTAQHLAGMSGTMNNSTMMAQPNLMTQPNMSMMHQPSMPLGQTWAGGQYGNFATQPR